MKQDTLKEPRSGRETRALTFEQLEDGRVLESAVDFGETMVKEPSDSNSSVVQGTTQGRQPRFSLRLLFLAVTVWAFVFVVIAHQRQQHRQRMGYRLARMFVQNALHDRHLKQWHSAAAGMNAAHGGHGAVVPNTWEFDVIAVTTDTVSLKLSKPPEDLDDFERKAIEQIQAGATDMANVSLGGEVRYVTAINSRKGCAACHARSGTIAVVSVRGTQE